VYEDPYHGLCYELLGKATAYEHLKKANTVEFRSTSFLRGVTLNDTIVIFDEAQNASFSEINTLVTRLGENSRLFICADALQTDLKQHESGYLRALKIWESMDSFGVVSFDHDDIVRSEVVKDWIIKCSEM
jgi:phosphate starvation-inducible PhoH-like protein